MKKLIVILIICLLTGAATVNAAYRRKQKQPNFFIPQTALTNTLNSNTTPQIQEQENHLHTIQAEKKHSRSLPQNEKPDLEKDYYSQKAADSMKQYQKDLQNISQGEKINNSELQETLSKFDGEEHILDASPLKE